MSQKVIRLSGPRTSVRNLSFAYIRNCSQFSDGNSREIFSWNVASIARALHELLAAHHATHFMGILVRLGIQYIKHNRASLWSIEAALCGLECSVFLDKWLRAFRTSTGPKSFTDQEHLLIAWTRDIVRDGSISINAVCPDLSSERPEDLVNCTIEVWCHIMQGDSPWPFINTPYRNSLSMMKDIRTPSRLALRPLHVRNTL
ncbi:hypothetical protein AO1008_02805 [Aspergillus oryzae 100-8]|uniref:Uncharacterized protein n=1 Tax=Aspergillus oryzae (strain 3.042) TaxID=1160506 RepID=I8IGL4_ASPO3|nr:hypothetical protein Ao3042_06311 [Aspergillus oryzae 3.042]KDE76679.1 hypothetical protein AO1008_02805 [Aspergillus oryzae 100-8]|eukprot:EIT77481.1 hypothetical protein Ao3042_06311 [Aspergillus oryzae 3.042]